jgi:hypothetical protein
MVPQVGRIYFSAVRQFYIGANSHSMSGLAVLIAYEDLIELLQSVARDRNADLADVVVQGVN